MLAVHPIARALAFAAALDGPAAAAEGEDDFVLHEWGTFPSFSGSDAVPLVFETPAAADLPAFVHEPEVAPDRASARLDGNGGPRRPFAEVEREIAPRVLAALARAGLLAPEREAALADALACGDDAAFATLGRFASAARARATPRGVQREGPGGGRGGAVARKQQAPATPPFWAAGARHFSSRNVTGRVGRVKRS